MPVSLVDVAGLSGLPGLGAAAQAVLMCWETVDNVKIYKQRCKHLRSLCVEILLQLRDSKAYKEGSPQMKEAIDIFEAKVLKINKRMSEWADLSLVKSVIKQSDISTGIDQLYTDISLSSHTLQFAGIAEISNQHQELRAVYERDQADLRDNLLRVVRQTDVITNILGNQGDVQQFMQTLQEEIQLTAVDGQYVDRDAQDLQKTLYDLHQKADLLPPITDLTYEIVKETEHAVAYGGDNDVYIGTWLGQEKVALKFTRGFNHSETARKRFSNEISIWRTLQHRNIVRLYGTATFGDYIYTVSPWMDNGDALKYLQNHPNADRTKLIIDVANGLNYLHLHGVAHGDLRCANILISNHGDARISDFGLSILVRKIAEASGEYADTRYPNLGGLRWRAPELIEYNVGERPVVTPATDVWSFGMLCVELLTGDRPFHGLRMDDIQVMKAITSHHLPARPNSPALDDVLWKIINDCWKPKPQDRPTMKQVLAALKPSTLLSNKTQADSFNASQRATFVRPLTISPASSPKLTPPSLPDPLNGDVLRRPRNNTGTTETSYNLYSPSLQKTPSSLRKEENLSNGIDGRTPSLPSASSIRTPPLLDYSSSIGTTSPATKSVPIPQPLSARQDNFTPNLSGRPSISFSLTPPSYPPSLREYLLSSGLPDERAVLDQQDERPRSPKLGSENVGDGLDIVYDATGSVVSGSSRALILRLVTETDSLELDIQFRDAFLTCYAAFVSASALLDELQSCYRRAEQNRTSTSIGVMQRILNIIRLWLSEHRVFPQDAMVLRDMKLFAQSAGGLDLSTVRQSSMLLIDSIEKMSLAIERPHFYNKAHSSKVYDGFKASLAEPRDYAIGFTLLAWDMYSDLLKSDFISWLEDLPGQEFVEKILEFWNKLSYWTRKMILEPENYVDRCARLKLFVKIAVECYKLRNYPCMSAIASACSHPWISQLKYTYGDLDKKAKEAISKLNEIMDTRENFKCYRVNLEEDWRQQKRLVPDLVVHTRDLRSLTSRIQSPVHADGNAGQVDFKRCTILSMAIKRILQYQSRAFDLERYREAGPLAYLECKLDSFSASDSDISQLESKALGLRSREQRAWESHERDFKAAGFPTKSERKRGKTS